VFEDEIEALIKTYDRPFEFKPTHSAIGNCIECYFTDTDNYAERIDSWLTIYSAFEDNRIVGLMLENIKTLLFAYDTLGLKCRTHKDSNTIYVHAMLANIPWVDPRAAKLEPYRNLLRMLRNITGATEATVELERHPYLGGLSDHSI